MQPGFFATGDMTIAAWRLVISSRPMKRANVALVRRAWFHGTPIAGLC
jgi:hypothetical protein